MISENTIIAVTRFQGAITLLVLIAVVFILSIWISHFFCNQMYRESKKKNKAIYLLMIPMTMIGTAIPIIFFIVFCIDWTIHELFMSFIEYLSKINSSKEI